MEEDPTLEEMSERYMAGEAPLVAAEDAQIAALSALVSDLVAILHQVAPEQSRWLLEARRRRLLALHRGDRQPEMEGQAEVEQMSLDLLEAVLRPKRPTTS